MKLIGLVTQVRLPNGEYKHLKGTSVSDSVDTAIDMHERKLESIEGVEIVSTTAEVILKQVIATDDAIIDVIYYDQPVA